MEKYDYLEAVTADVIDYLKDHEIRVTTSNRDELQDRLHDDLWTEDGVTGNGSGSYTFNTWQAEENLCHNMDLLKEAMDEFASSLSLLESAESCDVTIRCHLLDQAISAALDELEEDDDDEDDDNNSDDED